MTSLFDTHYIYNTHPVFKKNGLKPQKIIEHIKIIIVSNVGYFVRLLTVGRRTNV